MNVEIAAKRKSIIELKGGLCTLTAIQLLENDLVEIGNQLDEKIKQAPNFFQNIPLILDFYQLTQHTEEINFKGLVTLLRSKRLIPIGARGLPPALKQHALEAGLAIFPEEKKASPDRLQPVIETRVITQPVRSGQQIYAAGSDLIVLSSVSHGAEVLADGHIHVYGPLRGRALAGVSGNVDAMIMCRSLEAELVSIAGQYRLSDDLKTLGWKETVCIQLKANRLNIFPI